MRHVVNTLIVKTTPNVLVTLFKFLDDGPARTKIGNIIKKITIVSVESVDVGPSPHWSDDCIGGKKEQYK